jgi:pimeloyl-ACP methyl ester carboxylesterase
MWANLAPTLGWARPEFHDGPLPGEPTDATFVEVDGVRLHYLDVGRGPAVIFIHGFAASLEMWRRTFPAVARGRRIVAVDLKGFGWSSRPPGDYSHVAQAALLWKFLDDRGIRDAALVAHSWGAAVALAMALQAPARVRGAALYSAWVYQEQVPPFLPWALAAGVGEYLFSLCYSHRSMYRLALAFHDPRKMTRGLVAEAERMLRQPGSAAAALAAMRAMDFAAQQKSYPRLEVPTMLLWGNQDAVTPVGVADRLARDLRARVRLYPNCGHFPMIESVHESNADLAAFLSEVR